MQNHFDINKMYNIIFHLARAKEIENYLDSIIAFLHDW